MRQVATIADEHLAKKFADHLMTLDVTTRVDRTPQGSVVWVHREDRMDLAKGELEAFLADPANPRYDKAGKVAETVRKTAVKKARLHTKNSISLNGRLNVPSMRRCPVTYALIAVSIAVALLTGLGNQGNANQLFMFAPVTSAVEDGSNELQVRQTSWHSSGLKAIAGGQIWRLITPIFLHFGILHLAFNMMMLYRLGGLLELRKGRLVMLALVLTIGIFSNCAEYFWDLQNRGPHAPIQFGGMSGVVYGLFGYAWMKSDYEPNADIRVPTDLIVTMVLWLLLCMTDAIGPIANAAHVAGLFLGIMIGVTPHLWQSWR